MRRATFVGLAFNGLVVVTITYIFLCLTVHRRFRPLLLIPVTFNVLLMGVCPSVVLRTRSTTGKANKLLCCFCRLSR